MRILFDHGVPAPLSEQLRAHDVRTAYEQGWATLSNGELLARAQEEFDALITTDRHLKDQQNLASFKIAVLVLPTTSWPRLQRMLPEIAGAIESLAQTKYREL